MIRAITFDYGQRAAAQESEHAKRLAKHRNVYTKLTFLPTGSAEKYPFRDLHEACREVIKAFGPGRCVWGSRRMPDLPKVPTMVSARRRESLTVPRWAIATRVPDGNSHERNGRAHDAIEHDDDTAGLRDVDEPRRHDPELHQVDQVGAAGEIHRPRCRSGRERAIG